MVVRVNGAPRQGLWFSAGVRVVTITVDNSAWLADLTVVSTDPRQADVINSGLEQTLEVLATRGTVIGFTAVDADDLHVMVDYGQAYDPDSVTLGNQVAQDIDAEITAAINAITSPAFANATVDVFDGFTGVANGTPA